MQESTQSVYVSQNFYKMQVNTFYMMQIPSSTITISVREDIENTFIGRLLHYMKHTALTFHKTKYYCKIHTVTCKVCSPTSIRRKKKQRIRYSCVLTHPVFTPCNKVNSTWVKNVTILSSCTFPCFKTLTWLHFVQELFFHKQQACIK